MAPRAGAERGVKGAAAERARSRNARAEKPRRGGSYSWLSAARAAARRISVRCGLAR